MVEQQIFVELVLRSCMQVLKDVSWEVKKGERVGLVGINGAGKTTQLKIISGELEADSGSVLKAKPNMKIAYLTQVHLLDVSLQANWPLSLANPRMAS